MSSPNLKTEELSASWPSAAELLAAFLPERAGCLLAPHRGTGLPAKPKLGDQVELRARLADQAVEVIALCKVVERRDGAGWVLQFIPGQEGRRELLLSLARGESVPWGRRRSPRYSVILGAKATHANGSSLQGQVVNVSNDGLCLITSFATAVGAELRIRLWPMPYKLMWALALRGKVTACNPVNEQFALGINLQFVSLKQAKSWKKVVAAAAAKSPSK